MAGADVGNRRCLFSVRSKGSRGRRGFFREKNDLRHSRRLATKHGKISKPRVDGARHCGIRRRIQGDGRIGGKIWKGASSQYAPVRVGGGWRRTWACGERDEVSR